ncbi:hypothetical protein B0H14DRAFT_3444748 [Mycena olivaceomarginata]|nr:hypothetical protein B0H14DRAFT_3444748 [Mycena olivaceomarginata]
MSCSGRDKHLESRGVCRSRHLPGASVIALNQCQNPAVLPAASIPNLSSTVYASIVGSCAPSCPITQQNYVDFVYSQMTAAGVTNWPASADVVSQWWDPDCSVDSNRGDYPVSELQ